MRKRGGARRRAGRWGVVEVRSRERLGAPAWLAYWIELEPPGRVSIEIDPDRAATISRAAWRRARRALRVPFAIRVLDGRTARRVRRVVPARVRVEVTPDDACLRELATICDDPPEDDLDQPFR